MACESCPFEKSLQVAEEVVAANPGNAFSRHVSFEKQAELAVTRLVWDKMSIDCIPGEDNQRDCPRETDMRRALGFILGRPTVEIIGREQRPVNLGKYTND